MSSWFRTATSTPDGRGTRAIPVSTGPNRDQCGAYPANTASTADFPVPAASAAQPSVDGLDRWEGRRSA
ncbi:hypothetical protein FHX81_6999 [Saccharothrix saharensis]|uniref:Uncharacterized protein n=1 Tax=Saccharothrix saharensis TaxID=571190 RepID=A0A543JP56_9PSEU|nr:hypothetical protein [Saccharothrix saharensis]TQM84544.1 hypothetical protein FHX81_6999 [Saccharothrix saharensis]